MPRVLYTEKTTIPSLYMEIPIPIGTRKHNRRGSRGGEMGHFSPPFFLSPLLSFLFYNPSNIEIIFDLSDIITKIHPPFQNPGSALAQCDSKLPAPGHKTILSFSYDVVIEFSVSAFRVQVSTYNL